MGAPPLPAPTETDTTVPTEVDVESEISKPGDENSQYSLPEDGTPVTIRTRGHKANKSQTSLLIEYFEGSKSGEGSSRRRPSVRVRLTPSKKGKGDPAESAKYKGGRKASLTRRIPLSEAIAARDIDLGEADDDMDSYASATEESNVSRNPLDADVDDGRHSSRRRRPASPLIPSVESYAPGNQSEISAIPTDSFLDGPGGSREFTNRYSSPQAADALAGAGAGAAAGAAASQLHNRKTRGKERAKVSSRTSESREPKDRAERERERKHRPKSRKSSHSEPPPEETRSPRRRSSRSHQDSVVSGPDSSVLSSNVTHSTRSGVSKTSINNPKLLETVEDAIRRLILPELSALKREQSKRETRRGSLTSTGTYDSREDLHSDRRRSSGHGDSTATPKRRNREARHNYGGDASPMSVSRDSLVEDYSDHDGAATPRKGDMLKGALTGAALAKGLSAVKDDQSAVERRERRRRRPESARSRSLGRERYAEEYEDEEPAPPPPMPLMSDINPSELTRTSILSAESDRHSASEEQIRNVPRGSLGEDPTQIENTLGLHHENVSKGDLRALPRGQSAPKSPDYDVDEFGNKVPIEYQNFDREERRLSDGDDYAEPTYEEQYFTQQDVPPPLKYVPYQAGARGLSPIPSVTEASEAHHPRLSMVSGDVPSPQRSPDRQMRNSRSMHSMDSIPSNIRGHEFEHMAGGSRTPGAETYGEDSEVNGGQAVRGIAANPNIIHPPMGVESAVASLIDGSQIDQSLLSYSGNRDSTLSYDDYMNRSSRDNSPDKRYVDDRNGTPSAQSARSQGRSEDFSEYEIDEHGRKVPRQRYGPSGTEAVITAGAAAAAAAALKKAQGQKQASVEDEADFQGAGVARNKSFKERTMDGWEPRNTPAHSVDRFDEEDEPKMSARGGPDMSMPEAEYVDDDLRTNPSVVEDRLDGQQLHDEPWSRGATPTPQDPQEERVKTPTNDRGLGITEAAGVAALGAAAGMAAAHSHQPSQDEDWHRTSDERKRDTLVTNPYEDASPVANPALQQNLRGLDQTYGQNYNGSPYGAKFDEGYMSNGPNQTPEGKGKGMAINDASDDPFYVANKEGPGRQLSGMSQGMASPFYDAATGGGIDRIENKDIVALMQHLMVRDAQRSARDTEIVALLMNAALEMRNSFNEMKEMMQDTSDDVIFAGVENTEKLQKAIGGPRPYPGTAKSMQSSLPAGTSLGESGGKSKNLWKRALAGLSTKGTNDLSRIEEMLMHLLGEVDVLRTQTAQPGQNATPQSGRAASIEPEAQYDEDKGYEPEGASTATQGSRSAQNLNRQTTPKYERRDSNRVSTVPEDDEEYEYGHASPAAERAGLTYLSPQSTRANQRGMSVPLEASPRASGEHGALSAENTPNDRSKKHKSSSSSSWLPKISRWSETTASSVGRAFRGGKGKAKYDDYVPPSRSGSSLASYEDYDRDDQADKLHSGFSDPNVQGTVSSFKGPQDRASPSFKGPPDNIGFKGPQEIGSFKGPQQLASMFPEDPKYKAHRNSLNLQHPQPRPGQTERFRNALEYSAQEYDDPLTPRSADWAGSATSLHRLPPQNTNRYSNTSSQAARDREAEYQHWGPSTPGNNTQQSAPPRPPKEPVEGQQQPDVSTPPRTGGTQRLSNRNLNTALGVPSRKPSGPRAMTPKSPEEEAREERRRKRDTFGSAISNETDTF